MRKSAKPYYCPLCGKIQNKTENKIFSYCEKYDKTLKMKPLKFKS